MSKIKNIPSPLFDSLKSMLIDQDYQPALTQQYLQDYNHARNFLLNYRGSLDTFNSYRREIERFLQWCQLKANKSVKNIGRDDFESFLGFCQKPPKSWIALTVQRRFIEKNGKIYPNAKWRPFVAKVSKVEHQAGVEPNKASYSLSQKAFKSLFAIISSFYNYLLQEGYTQVNPALLIRQKSKYFRAQQTAEPVRRLSELQWGYVIETAEMMAERKPEKHVRTLFIMNLLYGLYLRISELVDTTRWTPTMGDFHRDSEGRWWFLTVGKGNKERKVTVSPAMLKALKAYRKSLGMSALPLPNEKTPLLGKYKDSNSLSSTRYIRRLVQKVFDESVERLKRDNQAEEATQLAAATVHWLRHTGISDDVKIRPKEHVRDDAGHSSSSITDKYIDVELNERHQSARRKRIRPEFLEENG